jgi:hypothetical protein
MLFLSLPFWPPALRVMEEVAVAEEVVVVVVARTEIAAKS